MRKKKEKIISLYRFEMGHGFFTEVSKNPNEDSWDVHVLHKDYGIKDLAFGDPELSSACELAQSFAVIAPYITLYKATYMAK